MSKSIVAFMVAIVATSTSLTGCATATSTAAPVALAPLSDDPAKRADEVRLRIAFMSVAEAQARGAVYYQGYPGYPGYPTGYYPQGIDPRVGTYVGTDGAGTYKGYNLPTRH